VRRALAAGAAGITGFVRAGAARAATAIRDGAPE